MSYEPTNWKSGDTVTSAKLNKLEQGVANAGGGYLIANMTVVNEKFVLDKTAGEILSAFENGVVMVKFSDSGEIDYQPIIFAVLAEGEYAFATIGIRQGELLPFVFTASSADDYPSASIG